MRKATHRTSSEPWRRHCVGALLLGLLAALGGCAAPVAPDVHGDDLEASRHAIWSLVLESELSDMVFTVPLERDPDAVVVYEPVAERADWAGLEREHWNLANGGIDRPNDPFPRGSIKGVLSPPGPCPESKPELMTLSARFRRGPRKDYDELARGGAEHAVATLWVSDVGFTADRNTALVLVGSEEDTDPNWFWWLYRLRRSARDAPWSIDTWIQVAPYRLPCEP